MRRHNAFNITSAPSNLGIVAQPNQTLLTNVAHITMFRFSFFHCRVCHVTGPQPLRKRITQKGRSSATSLKFKYILFFVTSYCSCLRLLVHLLVTSTFLSIMWFRKQLWPIQLPVLRFIVCRVFLFSLDYVILLHFLPDRSNWSSYSSATFQYFQSISPLFSEVYKFQHHPKLCSDSFIWHCLSWCIGHAIFSVVFLSTSRGPG